MTDEAKILTFDRNGIEITVRGRAGVALVTRAFKDAGYEITDEHPEVSGKSDLEMFEALLSRAESAESTAAAHLAALREAQETIAELTRERDKARTERDAFQWASEQNHRAIEYLQEKLAAAEAVVEAARRQQAWANGRCRSDGSEDDNERGYLCAVGTIRHDFDAVLAAYDALRSTRTTPPETPAGPAGSVASPRIPEPAAPEPITGPHVSTLEAIDGALGEALHEIGGISGSRGLGEFRAAVQRRIKAWGET